MKKWWNSLEIAWVFAFINFLFSLAMIVINVITVALPESGGWIPIAIVGALWLVCNAIFFYIVFKSKILHKTLILTPQSWAIGLSNMTGYPKAPDNEYWLRFVVDMYSTYNKPIDKMELHIDDRGDKCISANSLPEEVSGAFAVYFNVTGWMQKGIIPVTLCAYIDGFVRSSVSKKIDFNAEPGGFPCY